MQGAKLRQGALALLLTLGVAASGLLAPFGKAHAGSKINAQTHDVERAVEFWQKGQFQRARALLAAFEAEVLPAVDPATLEVALRYLADAALLDKTLDLAARQKIAGRAIGKIYERDNHWTPPRGIHGTEFYSLVKQLRYEREASRAASCVAERQACSAELAQVSHERGQLAGHNQQLQSALSQQVVIVEERTARNRAIALLPAGIGHFYNGRKKLGYAFLGTEVALGSTALSLLLYRVYGLGCQRTQGFAPGSLRCDVAPSMAGFTQRMRNAEQVLGILFLSSVIADIVTAQITFKAHSIAHRTQYRTPKISRARVWFSGKRVGIQGSF